VEEKVWASKLLTLFRLQTLKVQAETDEHGTWKLTKNSAEAVTLLCTRRISGPTAVVFHCFRSR
jgi:hypothetical protein